MMRFEAEPLRGFTLIELLIVVAIIAILAAIAVPNFLEAQVRAKASRARADMRSMATALEAYCVDNNAYPQAEINGTLKYLRALTEPVSYVSHYLFADPFTPDEWVDINQIPTYRYYGFDAEGVLNTEEETGIVFIPGTDFEPGRIRWYALFCHGPDGVRNNLSGPGFEGTFIRNNVLLNTDFLIHYIYDSTNGTRSPGEIFRTGGSPVGLTAPAARLLGAAQ